MKDAVQIFFRKFCFPNHEYIGQTRYAAYHMHIIRFEIEFSVQSMRQRKFWKSLKLTKLWVNEAFIILLTINLFIDMYFNEYLTVLIFSCISILFHYSSIWHFFLLQKNEMHVFSFLVFRRKSGRNSQFTWV